jgi:GT2 family glycosyltransferase
VIGAAIASVVIPAHDEEAVIAQCLETLLVDAGPGEFEVIVACNACTDATATIARGFAGVRVIEIDEASKPAALDAADACTTVFPRLYIDADIRISAHAARAVTEVLNQATIEAAAPRPEFDADGRSWPVRRYFDVFGRLPVFDFGYVGSGFFALSERGRARFTRWPRELPDDAFVARLIPGVARATADAAFVITAPMSLRAQVRRMVRVQTLNRALERHAGHELEPPTVASTAGFLVSELRHPRQWPGVVLVAAVSGVSRMRARLSQMGGRETGWMRDESIRSLNRRNSSEPQGSSTSLTAAGVDVVVVTYNSERDIGGFLDSLDALDEGGVDVRVTVVDNDSSDGTIERARRHRRLVEVIENDGNLGYAAAINVAMTTFASDSLVLVANPDLRLATGFLPPVMDAASDPSIGVVVSQLVDARGAALPSQRRQPAVRRTLAEALLGGRRAARLGLGELVTDPASYEAPRDVAWAVGALLAITPSARARVGPWDGSYFLYSEETDYLLRVHDAGLRVRYVPDAKAFHRGGASHEDPFLWATLTVNRVRLFGRRHGRLHSIAFWAATVVNELLRAPRSATHRQALCELLRYRRKLVQGEKVTIIRK